MVSKLKTGQWERAAGVVRLSGQEWLSTISCEEDLSARDRQRSTGNDYLNEVSVSLLVWRTLQHCGFQWCGQTGSCCDAEIVEKRMNWERGRKNWTKRCWSQCKVKYPERSRILWSSERTDWSSCVVDWRTKPNRSQQWLLVSVRKLANSFQNSRHRSHVWPSRKGRCAKNNRCAGLVRLDRRRRSGQYDGVASWTDRLYTTSNAYWPVQWSTILTRIKRVQHQEFVVSVL